MFCWSSEPGDVSMLFSWPRSQAETKPAARMHLYRQICWCLCVSLMQMAKL